MCVCVCVCVRVRVCMHVGAYMCRFGASGCKKFVCAYVFVW